MIFGGVCETAAWVDAYTRRVWQLEAHISGRTQTIGSISWNSEITGNIFLELDERSLEKTSLTELPATSMAHRTGVWYKAFLHVGFPSSDLHHVPRNVPDPRALHASWNNRLDIVIEGLNSVFTITHSERGKLPNTDSSCCCLCKTHLCILCKRFRNFFCGGGGGESVLWW